MFIRALFAFFVFATILIAVPAPLPESAPAVSMDNLPDTSRMVSLVGRSGVAHGCPVAATRILSNRHVLYDEEADRPVPYRAESQGINTVARTRSISHLADLGEADLDEPLPEWYPIAIVAPLPGDRLTWVGYNWTRGMVFGRQVFAGHLERIVAGSLVLDRATPQGSSGSCLLNDRGEVVGVIAWGIDDKDTAVAVGVYGRLAKDGLPTGLPEPAFEKKEAAPANVGDLVWWALGILCAIVAWIGATWILRHDRRVTTMGDLVQRHDTDLAVLKRDQDHLQGRVCELIEKVELHIEHEEGFWRTTTEALAEINAQLNPQPAPKRASRRK